MDAAVELRLLASIQYAAFFYSALKVSLDTLTSFVAYQFGPDAPPPDRIESFLRQEKTQRTLESHYETALWKSAADNSWHLISLSPITDPAVAKRRLAEFPKSRGISCSWCYQESRFPHLELQPELDIKREPTGRMLHKACQRPWGLLRALVERGG